MRLLEAELEFMGIEGERRKSVEILLVTLNMDVGVMTRRFLDICAYTFYFLGM